MKKFMYLAAALAVATGFTACSNDDDEQTAQSGEKQSIVVKFEGVNTRAIGPSQSAGKVNLNDAKIVLIANDKVYDTKTVKSGDGEDWTNLNGDGLVIHEVPSNVNKVVVLGNVDGVNLNNDAPGSTLDNLQKEALEISQQQDFNKVTLYGIDEELTKREQDDEHGTVMVADVNIKPLVARVEIGNIKCTNLSDSKYSEITLKDIGLLNIYDKVTVAGQATGTKYDMNNVTEPGKPEEGKIEFGSEGKTWAWDAIADNTKLTASETVINPSEGNKWVYQVAPCSPILKLYIAAKMKDGGSTDPFNNTVTASSFTGTGYNDKFEAGKIYTIDLAFPADKIHPWNPDETQCIQVAVKVAKWEVVALTPNYE